MKGFQEPLVRTVSTSKKEDLELEKILAAFQESSGGIDFSSRAKPIADFVLNHPASGWNSSLFLNLGIGYYYSGYFSRAFDAWKKAWDIGKTSEDPSARAVVDRAVTELARMHARIGHLPELEQIFAEIGSRKVTGSSTEILTGAREGALEMKIEPGMAYLCGPKALKNVMLFSSVSPKDTAYVDEFRSGPGGVSLSEVYALATKGNFPVVVAKRVEGTTSLDVPVPSIIHWKMSHYAAIIGKVGGRFLVKDPTFGGNDLWVSQAAIESEGSGYFVIPKSKYDTLAKSKWRPIDPKSSEASSIYGMGYTNKNEAGASGGNALSGGGGAGGLGGGGGGTPDPKLPSDTANDSVDPGTCEGSGHGMCAVSANLMLASLRLKDIPVGYAPKKGPPVFVHLVYNQREASQPANFSYSNIGSKWSLGTIGFVQDDPSYPGQNVSRVAPEGGFVDYPSAPYPSSPDFPTYATGYDVATGAFVPELHTQRRLVRIPAQGPATSYELRYPDGSKQVYGQPDGSNFFPRRMFLTEIVDPQGLRLVLHYDSSLRLTSITDATGRNTVFSYELSGAPLLVTKIADPFGRHADLDYDSSGRLISITDVIGITSSFTYDSSGLINALQTPYGTSTFIYGETPFNISRFLEMTDPMGFTERVEFNHITTPVMPSSENSADVPVTVSGMLVPFHNDFLQFRNTYYWDKYVLSLARPGPSVQADYTLARWTHWLHNPAGQTSPIVESLKDPLESRRWIAYPGQVNTITEGLSAYPMAYARVLDDGTTQVRRTQYNGYGLLTQSADAFQRIQNLVRSNMNGVDLIRLEQKTSDGPDASFSTLATYAYDAHHRVVASTNDANQTSHFEYDSDGLLVSATNSLGEKTIYTRDGFGRITMITNPNGALQWKFTYDAFDRIATRTDSEGMTLSYTYDDFDRLLSTTYPDGTQETRTYDRLDLASTTDRLGRTTEYTYDANRRLVSVIDPLGRNTRFSYYPNGVLKSITEPNNATTSWDIDIESRPTEKHLPDGSFETYEYEAKTSRLHAVTDAKGQKKIFTYTIDDRVASVHYANALVPTSDIYFEYDPYFPRIVSRVDGEGEATYSYGALGTLDALKVKDEYAPTGTNAHIRYAYDELGRLKTRLVDTSSETFGYDALGRLIGTDNSLGSFNYSYLGQTAQKVFAGIQATSGTQSTSYEYESNLGDRRLKAIRHAKDGVDELILNYSTDPYRILTTLESGNSPSDERSSTYDYDADDQILDATVISGSSLLCKPQPHGKFKKPNRGRAKYCMDHPTHCEPCEGGATTSDFSYEYDPNGNLTTLIEEVPGSISEAHPTYNPLNEILNWDGSTPYLYDRNGNLTYDGERTYTWDAENRLVEIGYSADPTKKSRFRYDGLNRRVAITEITASSSNETKYLWCGESLCRAENSGIVTRRYFADGEFHRDPLTAATQRLLLRKDHRGSVREVLSLDTGSVIGRSAYSPFGHQLASSTPVPSEFQFAGLFHHEASGLEFATYRQFDSRNGRWLSKDPIGFLGKDTNLYRYVHNGPVDSIDPLGLAGIDDYRDGEGGSTTGTNVYNTYCSITGSCEPIPSNPPPVAQQMGKATFDFFYPPSPTPTPTPTPTQDPPWLPPAPPPVCK